MQTIQIDPGARRWTLRVAMLGLLAALFVGLASVVDAQSQQPKPPHWFWGRDADAYAGASVVAVDASGDVVSTAQEGSGVVGSDGAWYVSVSTEDATRIKLRLVATNVTRETGFMDVVAGGFDEDPISISAFAIVEDAMDMNNETISVRIIARRAPDGRIEFGMRDQNGADIFPRARYFPNGGPGHSRWLRSSEIDFGGGFVGRIIARYVEEDGRTEFGFRVEGYDDIFPRARYFPATGPDHNRFLRSSEIEIGQPR